MLDKNKAKQERINKKQKAAMIKKADSDAVLQQRHEERQR
jgi:hypothetical protein